MKSLRKILSVVLVMTLCVSNIIFADDGDKNQPVDSYQYEFLTTIGVLQEQLTNVPTRAEFVAIVVKMIGLDSYAKSMENENIFSDISSNKYEGYINVAYKQGLISKNSEGIFNPNNQITYNEAIKIIVSALGYDGKANAIGGYPMGFVKVANDLNILKGIGASNFDANSAIKLVYNAMLAPIAKQNGVSADGNEYVVDENVTCLSEYFDIYNDKGIIWGNSATRLDGTSNLSEDEILIKQDNDFILLKTDLEPNKTKLGYHVEYFYKYNDGENSSLIFTVYTDKNKELVIKSDDIVKYNNGIYTYTNEYDKTMDVKVSNVNIILYNGVAYMPIDNKDFIPEYGEVTLIGNSGGSSYDLAVITNVTTMVIGSISIQNQVIRDMYDLSKSLELKDIDYKVYKNGKIAQLVDLERWDVLSVVKSKNNTNLEIYASNKFKEGQISQKSTEDEIVIDGVTYKLAKNVIDNNLVTDLLFDTDYTFYFDMYGAVGAIETGVLSQNEYAYLVGINSSDNPQKPIVLKLFTKNNKFEIEEPSDKLRLNGVTVKSTQQIVDVLKPQGQFNPQLLKLKRNTSGLINSIETATTDNTASETEFRLSKSGVGNYKNTHKIFGGEFYVNDEAQIFMVPNDPNITEEEMFKYSKAVELENNKYTYKAYDMNDFGMAKVVVVESGLAASGIEDNDSKMSTIHSITQAIDKKGEVRELIYFIQDGMLKSSFVNKYAKDITGASAYDANGKLRLYPGDTIRYLTDPQSGEINYYQKHYNNKNPETVLGEAAANSTLASRDYNSLLRFVSGQAISRNGGTVKVRIKRDETYVEHYFSLSRSIFTVCKTKKNGEIVVSKGSIDDIVDYLTVGDMSKTSKLFMRQRYGDIMETVIYINE